MIGTSRASRSVAKRSKSFSVEPRPKALSPADKVDCEAFQRLLNEANRGFGRYQRRPVSTYKLQEWTGVKSTTWTAYSRCRREITLEHKLLIVRVWNQHVLERNATKLTPQDVFPSWAWSDLTPPAAPGIENKTPAARGADRQMLAELLRHWDMMDHATRAALLRKLPAAKKSA